MVGETLKHYRIESALGKGGMGVVYRAEDTKLRRPVALKVLSAELTADPERRRRFLLEARSAAVLTHPSIAQVYDVDEADGVTFIAMELVEGRTVRQMILDRELDLLGAMEIGIQVSEGLAKAHEAGIVHRDIKSENVMLTSDGHAKILDFGLAKLLDPVSGGNGDPDPSDLQTMAQTQVGMVMGTVAYMSPEQARGRSIDHRSDIFSIGVMLYEMATGELPFQGNTPLDTMHAIAFEETRPMASIRQNLPIDLQRIVSRCLRKRAEDRYPDARTLAEDLKVVKRDTESGKIRALSWRDRFRDGIENLRTISPREWGWYVVGAAALGGFLYFLFSDGESLGSLLVMVMMGLLCYRWVRNRPQKMLQRFVRKVSRFPEVQLITHDDGQVQVFVERAPAKLYQRINDLMAAANKKIFFGDPMKVTVRGAAEPAEIRGVLSQVGVQYVRDDVVIDPPAPE